ncbi:tRNA (adenosine(37)-N6)-threonylcarbamoyltransferase complex ATPase subunit type 1 TsaE [Candidatus Gracilibacteria bacterium]|nr:tRNA (adenosine(37)-N6)-threonylcarbamoyltransferase complex ATPase subunit type 1 TsaE [Candidatus Gracilibacteria bacterium]MCF7856576.1 tRNA (adenosine(37)-N6)-threonylcarbamoyltransferase complex ATPase subunit type 1 TsaE [Candidatus Gracilibacteria bacterium]MCF7896876.1 tRNA (adenosine(37)-N6)-threonylcarbamoyltransferase complex ATPase subunit type 1 TsaE [Candidatus Gracilibacteria bacterium]
MKSIFQTVDSDETETLGEQLASQFRGQKIFLFGDLGVGKTTFLRGLARGLKISSKIKSPTFVGEHIHKTSDKENLIHLDLYRAESLEIEKIERLQELFNSQDTVVMEWSERLPKKMLPKKRVELRFRELQNEVRRITLAKFSGGFHSIFSPMSPRVCRSPSRL